MRVEDPLAMNHGKMDEEIRKEKKELFGEAKISGFDIIQRADLKLNSLE